MMSKRPKKKLRPIIGPDARYGDLKPAELLAIVADGKRDLGERLECFSRVAGAKLEPSDRLVLAEARQDLIKLLMAKGWSHEVSGGMVYEVVPNQDMTWSLKASLKW